MNLFACCKEVQSGMGYRVTSRGENNKTVETFYKTYDSISSDQLSKSNMSVVKLVKSDYETIVKDYGKKEKKWTDGSFPPNDQSLGVINGIESSSWKRISQIILDPILLNNHINPNHILQFQYPDKAFLATVAALAQHPQRIQQIFGDQTYNPSGFYKINLRVNSEVQEVLIDDFVPVGEDGTPLFAKPYADKFWVMLLEKARAKVYGSYEQLFMSDSSVKDIFQQLTFAPTEKLVMNEQAHETEKEKFWKCFWQNTFKNRPIVAQTTSRADINWVMLHLEPSHYYTLIDSASLKNSLGKEQRILKLRNPSGTAEWKGTGNSHDNIFWDQIQPSEAKDRFLHTEEYKKEGVFYMLFSDFLKYFGEVCINYYESQGSFFTEDLFFDFKHGIVHELEIFNEGFYTISVDARLESYDDGIAKTSILLIRKYKQQSGTEYEFVDGFLNVDRSTPLVKGYLSPGTYVVYTKIRPTPQQENFPKNPQLIIYSEKPVRIHPSRQEQHPNLLKKTFLAYARTHKRQYFNDDLMWTSWKLFNQGGYGYFAFGNDKDSKEKFVITLNEEDFTSQGYTLKKPLKGKGANQKFEVNPGEQGIILLTVANSQIKNRKFPPKFGVNIHPFTLQKPPTE